MNAVARKNAMQMALHDELFYQMAMEEGITLDDNDQKHMDNKLEDFWEDLTERQGKRHWGFQKDAKDDPKDCIRPEISGGVCTAA